MKKIFLFISFLIIIIVAVCFSAFSADPLLLKKGYYSESSDISWSIYDDGSMVINGSGEIPAFENYAVLPYFEMFEEGIVESLVIKDGITGIGDYAFYGCSADTVEIAPSVKKLGSYGFFGMENVENISLSQNISSLGSSVFSCSDQLKISVDTNNEHFITDEYGIIYDFNKNEIVFCPVGSDLTNYIFPSSLTHIRDNAFNGVKNLYEVEFPKSLKTIGEKAFENCENLTTVIFNYGIETVKNGAFANCNNLNDIFYYSTYEVLADVSMDGCGIDKSDIICGYCRHNNTISLNGLSALCNNPGYTESVYCNDCGIFTVDRKVVTENHTDSDDDGVCENCAEDYCCAIDAGFALENDCSIIWVLYNNGNLVIYGNGKMEDYYASQSPFYKHRGTITKVTVSDDITYIGANAFYEMECLETVSGGDNVLSVGEGAFENAEILSNIEGLSNLETVKERAFRNCALQEWSFCSKIKNIGDEGFCGCNFADIRLSDCVETLGDRAFYKCTFLEKVFIGQKVCSIGEDIFGQCSSLYQINADEFNTDFSVKNGVLFDADMIELIKYPPAKSGNTYQVPDGIEIISCGAFSGCKDIETIIFNEELRTIGDYAFAHCSSISSIEIAAGVEKIGKSVFSYCNKLENISIPVSVNTIDKFSFSYCTNLKAVTMPSGVTRISEGTFYRCDNLEKIIFEGNITEIEKSAFGLCNKLKIVFCSGDEADFSNIVSDKTDNEYFLSAPKHFSTHTLSPVPEVLPVCVNVGYTAGTYCKQCDFYITGHKEIASEYSEHNLGEYTVFRQSTCTSEGEERAYCIRDCGYYNKKAIDVKNHSYEASVFLPTCTEKGYTVYVCICGDVYTDNETEATNHNLSEYYIVSASKCTENGIARAECTKCEYYTEKSIPANGHKYSIAKVVKPTCTSEGYSIYTCHCGNSVKSETVKELGHSFNKNFTVDEKATCKTVGSKSRHCKRCDLKTDIKEIEKLYHSYTYVIKGATLKKNGSKKKTCSFCGKVESTEKIYKIKFVKLAKTSFVYNGKRHQPTVIVKDSKGKELKIGTDYIVKFQSGRKKSGKYTVTVKFKGNYSGSKVLAFKIIPANVKAVTSEPSIKSIKLSWSETKGATGYRIYYYDSKSKKYVTLKDTKNLSYTVRKIDGKELKSGTDYKFAVKAYSDNEGIKVYSSKSKKHTTATKPSKVYLKTSSASSGRIMVKWKKTGGDGYEIVYATNKSFSSKKTVTVKNPSATKTVLNGIVRGKTYFIKIRAYKTINGKKVYGYYSNVRKIKSK